MVISCLRWILNQVIGLHPHVSLARKHADLLVLGLDNAGKATLIYKLLYDRQRPTYWPRLHGVTYTIQIKNTIFHTPVLSGHPQARRLWKDYITSRHTLGTSRRPQIHFTLYNPLSSLRSARQFWEDWVLSRSSSGLRNLGLVYLVDASVPERFAEAKRELDALMRIGEMENVPVLVLGNKIDKSGAVERIELAQALELDELQEETRRAINFLMCSAVDGIGYQRGFEWLSKAIFSTPNRITQANALASSRT